VLVIPIDKAAPKGRLILPEQQAIRDLLDAGATAIVTQDVKLEQTLKALGKDPRLVITDSQAFGMVNRIVPPRIPLTSFSILMARHKGNLAQAVEGVAFLKRLQDGDHVLISEGCTHHRQCGGYRHCENCRAGWQNSRASGSNCPGRAAPNFRWISRPIAWSSTAAAVC
jgi:predicted GTPase